MWFVATRVRSGGQVYSVRGLEIYLGWWCCWSALLGGILASYSGLNDEQEGLLDKTIGQGLSRWVLRWFLEGGAKDAPVLMRDRSGVDTGRAGR